MAKRQGYTKMSFFVSESASFKYRPTAHPRVRVRGDRSAAAEELRRRQERRRRIQNCRRPRRWAEWQQGRVRLPLRPVRHLPGHGQVSPVLRAGPNVIKLFTAVIYEFS
jgi:hypothetical protein